jgi:decaprenyl-phosphate phosphoribosyltransferase
MRRSFDRVPPRSSPASPARDGAVAWPAPATRPARRASARAVLATARPRQWIKNLLVIAAAGAAGALGRDDVPYRVGLACVAFCMLASGIYAINDVRDAAEDRRHPVKRRRPVAAGELAPRTALITGAGSLLAGLALCTAIRPLLGLVGAGYVVLTLTYTLLWRHLAGLDILAIAGGFVLRAVAGGVAAPVTLSRWFLLVVTFAALLLAAGKRYSELARTTDTPAPGRGVLRQYGAGGLRAILAGSAVGVTIAYAAWAFELPLVDGIPWRPASIVPFLAVLARYGKLLARGGGEAPEELVLGDRVLGVAALAWVLLFAVGVNAA